MTYSKNARTLTQPESWWELWGQLAEKEGISLSEWVGKQVMQQIGRANEIPRQRKGRPRVYDVSAAEVASLRAEGETLRAIADRLGVSVRVVRDRLAESEKGGA